MEEEEYLNSKIRNKNKSRSSNKNGILCFFEKIKRFASIELIFKKLFTSKKYMFIL
jgi:hypothetical protein